MTPRWFNIVSVTLAWILVLFILLVPMVAISAFSTFLLLGGHHASGSTVGVGVILRATLRRIFRTGARNVMQTTMSTFTRTTARAITRRVVRVAVKSLMVVVRTVLVLKAPPRENALGESENAATAPPAQPAVVAILLGFIALFFSLWGILYLLEWHNTPFIHAAPQLGAALATGWQGPLPAVAALEIAGQDPSVDHTLQQVSPWLVAFLGAVPLPCYALLIGAAARWQRVQARFQTSFDGILLQAYFTGGGSFLPLTTDVEYEGSPRATAAVAAISLGGMFLLHLALQAAALTTGQPELLVASALFLLYCFVFSFPIRPLDGQYLWAYSRWLWLVFWLPILASFLLTLPESINAIL